jgi:hypothetical protein
MAYPELKNKYARYQTAVEILTDLVEYDNEAPQLNPIIIYLKEKKNVISKAILDEENIKNIEVDSVQFVIP